MVIKHRNISYQYKEPNYYRGSWLQIIRPLTLTGTITPILVGTGLAYRDGYVNIDLFIVYLITAIIIQATINMLNDYFDFLNGQDEDKWIKEISCKQKNNISLKMIPIVASTLLTIACISGVWLALESSLFIIPIGIISIVAGVKYSAGKRSFASLAMGEVIAFIFLGIVVTTLSYIIQAKHVTAEVFFVSLLFGLLISSMILTNNIRDIEKDKPFRKTVAIYLGHKRSLKLLFTIISLIYILVGYLLYTNTLPNIAVITFISLPLACKLLRSYREGASDVEHKLGMKWAALHHFIFGILLTIAVWI